MRVIWVLILFCLASCSGNRYLLMDRSVDKDYLSDYIFSLQNRGLITHRPLLVVDGSELSFDHLNSGLLLRKEQIISLNYIEKNNINAINEFGGQAENGVIIIETNTPSELSGKYRNYLYWVDNRKMLKAEIHALDPRIIRSISVIKTKRDVLRFTSEDVEGVVLVELKY